jgi:hypothetical protein
LDKTFLTNRNNTIRKPIIFHLHLYTVLIITEIGGRGAGFPSVLHKENARTGRQNRFRKEESKAGKSRQERDLLWIALNASPVYSVSGGTSMCLVLLIQEDSYEKNAVCGNYRRDAGIQTVNRRLRR